MADDDFSYLSSLSAHPNRPGDTSNFNPTFAGNLAAALRDANAAGLKVGIESAYRTPGQTGSSFDRSGRSLHSYGLAADISGLGGPNSAAAKQWATIAAQHGLYNPYGVGNRTEFNHWQGVPNELTLADVPRYQQAFAQGNTGALAYANTGATAPASAAINAAAGPGRGLSTGLSRSNPFIYALGNAESNWRNIPSTVDKDPAGPGTKSQGFLQIDTPTWRQYAPGVGVTAPNAMAASEADQIKVASAIPFSRFGPRTQRLLHQQFGAFNNSSTVGQLAGMTPLGQGGIGSDAVAAAKAAPAATGTTLTSTGGLFPGFTSKEGSDAFLKSAAELDKGLGGSGNIPGAGGQGGGGGGEQMPGPSPMLGMAMARNIPGPGGMGSPGAAQQMLAGLQAGQPMGPTGPVQPFPQIGSQPIGQNPWAGTGVQGTSLTSLPGWQALAMQAAPNMIYGYDPYSQGAQFPMPPPSPVGTSLNSFGYG